MKVLVADDDEQGRYQLEQLLRTAGHEIVVTSTGAEALAQARIDPPDLILSDILMPVMDGYALCRACKADPRTARIPLVFYTATYTDPRDEEFALSLGASRFLVKPIEPEALLAALEQVMEESRSGVRPVPTRAAEPEAVYLREYNEALIRRLESKVHDLEQSRRELRAAVASHQDFVENAVVGIYRVSLDGRYLDVNPALVKMLGYASREDLLAVDVATAVYRTAEDRPLLLADMLRDGRIEARRVKWQKKDGSPVTVRLHGRVVYAADGTPSALEMVAADVTAYQSLEDQLRQSQKMEAVGQLAGGIAHDFNNLLTAIGGFAHMLLDELTDENARIRYAREIIKASGRAATLTGQLLAFSRKQVLQPEVLDLNVLVDNDARMVGRVIGEDVTLITRLGAEDARVNVDSSQISQVLLNLAVNGRDAMPAGGTLTIETSITNIGSADAARWAAARPGRYVRLQVSDTGHGIDADTRSRIFEPFFTTKEQGKGTGLGLSTVLGIVEQSGGFVDVSSGPGRGTTFDIYLPAQLDPVATAPTPGAAAQPIPHGSVTILLAEDNDGVRAVAAEMLKRLGYTVLAAANGEEALRISSEHGAEIQLLIADVVMPGMEGRELAQQLLRSRPGLKVMYCSGYTDHAIVKDGHVEGGRAFIQKPYSRDDLARKIREVLDSPPLPAGGED